MFFRFVRSFFFFLRKRTNRQRALIYSERKKKTVFICMRLLKTDCWSVLFNGLFPLSSLRKLFKKKFIFKYQTQAQGTHVMDLVFFCCCCCLEKIFSFRSYVPRCLAMSDLVPLHILSRLIDYYAAETQSNGKSNHFWISKAERKPFKLKSFFFCLEFFSARKKNVDSF